MNTPQFDTTLALARVRQKQAVQRRRRFRQSRLEKFRVELVVLYQQGASFREMAAVLKQEKKMKIWPSTIRDFLIKLPEVKEKRHVDQLS